MPEVTRHGEQGGRLREAGAQAIRDLLELRERTAMIGLGKDRANERGHRLARPVRHRGEEMAHEVHTAALPARAAEHRRERLLEPLVPIGDGFG